MFLSTQTLPSGLPWARFSVGFVWQGPRISSNDHGAVLIASSSCATLHNSQNWSARGWLYRSLLRTFVSPNRQKFGPFFRYDALAHVFWWAVGGQAWWAVGESFGGGSLQAVLQEVAPRHRFPCYIVYGFMLEFGSRPSAQTAKPA
jgi:hypothetical protein